MKKLIALGTTSLLLITPFAFAAHPMHYNNASGHAAHQADQRVMNVASYKKPPCHTQRCWEEREKEREYWEHHHRHHHKHHKHHRYHDHDHNHHHDMHKHDMDKGS